MTSQVPGFCLGGKLGLSQLSIRNVKENVSLTCLRYPYLFYLSRKIVIGDSGAQNNTYPEIKMWLWWIVSTHKMIIVRLETSMCFLRRRPEKHCN